jgi:hypothetical protein
LYVTVAKIKRLLVGLVRSATPRRASRALEGADPVEMLKDYELLQPDQGWRCGSSKVRGFASTFFEASGPRV